MKNLKIGFIGAGKHAQANIYPSVKLLGVDIQSISTRNMETAQAATDKFHAKKAYDNYQEMLQKEKLDVVFVITSGDQHANISIDCLRAGAHVFVEKPLGWTVKEAKEVAEVSKETKKHLMVGFMKRFAPAYVEMKNLISDKESFGEVLTLTGMFGVRAFGDEEIYLKYGAIHTVDLLRYYLGEIKEVVGYKTVIDKNVSLAFSFVSGDGKNGNMFLAGLPSWSRHYEEMTITGVNGFAKVENIAKLIHHSHQELETANPRWQNVDVQDSVVSSVETSGSGGFQTLYISGFVNEVQHFLESIANGEKPQPSAEDNVKTMELVEKILENLK